MTKTTRWLVSSVALLVLASPGAMAQATVEGWYWEVGGGLSVLADINAERSGSSLDLQHDDGFMLSGAMGKQFQNVHVEAEAFYSLNEFSRIGGQRDTSGDLIMYGAMGNVYYDFDFGRSWRPYIGGGVGFVFAEFDGVSATGFSNTNDNDDALAYQLRAGISWSLNNHMDLLLDYRYLITEEMDFWSSAGSALTRTDRIEQHGIQARVRFRF